MTEVSTPKLTQKEIVLNHLRVHGYITDVVAQSYGVRRLASRIDELKNHDEYSIIKEMRRDDLGRRYAYYTFA
jgi:hypothetical protein